MNGRATLRIVAATLGLPLVSLSGLSASPPTTLLASSSAAAQSQSDRTLARLKLGPLGPASVGPGDVELRLWVMSAIGPSEIYVMKRVAGRWSARRVEVSWKGKTKSFTGPRSTDWAAVFADLEQRDLQTITLTREASCHTVNDGVSYRIELAEGDVVTSYGFNNPQVLRSENGDRFLELLPPLYRAFGEDLSPSEDVSRMPKGEEDFRASLSSDDPIGPFPGARPWPAGTPDSAAAEHLSAKAAIASGRDLTMPTCLDLLGSLPLDDDVVMDLLIDVDGTVRAARAMSGRFRVTPAIKTALRWRFQPRTSGTQLRETLLTLRIRRESDSPSVDS